MYLYSLYAKIDRRMDYVPPLLNEPAGTPFFPLKFIIFAHIWITYTSICLTYGNRSTCKGLAKENFLDKFITKSEWVFIGYREPER